MCRTSLIFTICALWSGAVWGQESDQPPRKADDPGIALNRMEWPRDAVVVITQDLKKALDALGAGSVVLSAERYRELMARLTQLTQNPDKANAEWLFAACKITGEVKSVGGRDFIDLQIELECRTESPNTFIPIPFKGLHFSSASLNGQAPIWGPDPEKLSVLVSQPQVIKLQLRASKSLSRQGNERRLTLDRIPAATVTSLEVNVPGAVTQAFVRGYGGIASEATKSGSRLRAEALGVLSSLELSWRTSDSSVAASIPVMESETQVTLDDASALMECKWSLSGQASIQLPWKVKVPATAAQFQAELSRQDANITEPLIVTRNSDDTLQITSPYPTATMAYTHLVLRWRQALPAPDSKETTLLGVCDVVHPGGRIQSGTLTVTSPEDSTVLLFPRNLISIDRARPSQNDRDGKSIKRYRFEKMPAALEAIALPRAIARGAVELKMQHVLAVRDGQWVLHTEVDVSRSARANPVAMEFFWPSDWSLNRNILFSPLVRDIEHDQANQRLRIHLEGKQPGSFQLRLESVPITQTNHISLQIPYLVQVLGAASGRREPLEIVPQPERLRVDPGAWNIQLETGTQGISGEEQDSLAETFLASRVRNYQITAKPASVVITKAPRLPRVTTRAELFLDPSLICTRQTFEFQWDGPVPRQLQFLVPNQVRSISFAIPAIDGSDTPQTLVSIPQGDVNDAAWQRHVVTLPPIKSPTLAVICRTVSDHQAGAVTAPLIRLAEDQAHTEKNMAVRCVYDRRLKAVELPEGLPGWSATPTIKSGADAVNFPLELQGTMPLRLLALRVDAGEGQSPGAPMACQVHAMHCFMTRGPGQSLSVQSNWDLRRIAATLLTLTVEVPPERLQGIRCQVNGDNHPIHVESNQAGTATQLRLQLAPEILSQSVLVQWQWTMTPLSWSAPWLSRIPRMDWGASTGYLQTWRLPLEPAHWLLYASLEQDPVSDHAHWPPGTAQHDNQFQTLGPPTSLTSVQAPRFIVVLLLSALSFGITRFLFQRPRVWRWFLFGALGFVLVVLLFNPGVIWVLVFGALPGVTMASIVALLERSWQKRQLPPRVFSIDHANPSTLQLTSERKPNKSSITDAPTMIAPGTMAPGTGSRS